MYVITKETHAPARHGRKTKIKPERDRMIFQVLRAIKGQTAAQVARGTYICPQTIRNMRKANGEGTKYPQSVTLQAILDSQGLKFAIVEKD